MKNKKTIPAACISFLIVLVLSSFYFSEQLILKESSGQLTLNFQKQLAKLDASVIQFESNILKQGNPKSLLKDYQSLRKNYKTCGYLLSYLDQEYTYNFINGAPLPHLQKKVPELVVLDPQGFQVIDELLAQEDYDHVVLSHHLQELSKRLRHQIQFLKNSKLQSRHVLEALRLGVLEVMSLGVTGFDTPGTALGVEDASAVLKGMSCLVAGTLLETQELKRTLTKAGQYLKKDRTDFDRFDRYTFIREYLLPIYAQVVSDHEAFGVEYFQEVFLSEDAINYQASSPFDANFLNASYYSALSKGEGVEDLVTLGKTLFFDPALSANGQRACSSCHRPDQAFTDGQKTSLAFDYQGRLQRNTPTVLNSVYASRYFWDLRADQLSHQFEHVIFNELEFNTTTLHIIDKLNKSTGYVQLFRRAYPETTGYPLINPETISRAIESYVETLVGNNSRFDQSMRKELELSTDEISGFNLFAGKAACATCHFLPTFSGLVPPYFKETESEVLGVPMDKTYTQLDPDYGRSASGIQKEKTEIYNHSFKTVTLRNIASTAPYMHNGVFETLEEVMEFYDHGGGVGHGFEVPNQTLSGDSLHLTPQETRQIILFMRTLTDTTTFRAPSTLPVFESLPGLNDRVIGGAY